MMIALDFDETYTVDPEMWDDVISVLRVAGHTVVIVTYRHPVFDADGRMRPLQERGVPIVFTNGRAKKRYTEDMHLKIDIWIDDNPRAIYEDSSWKHDSPELFAWRETNVHS